MNGPKTTMTVHYGTFSCTLEGFDDPFNILQQLTAHFRAVTAEDRHFGADPRPMPPTTAPPADAEDDPSVTRLIREADTQMNEPRNLRRQSAIRQLRAMVATRAADRLDRPDAEAGVRVEPTPLSTGFASFAERLGAETPPELVEAAAVWSLCMEQRPAFTRPQLLRHVATLASLTHETMVEAFDSLVAAAILERQEKGRYALTSRSVFLREIRG